MAKNAHTKIFHLTIVFVIAVVIAIAIISTQPKQEETIKIGAIYPLTGAASYLGEGNSIGAIIAADLLNGKGGIKGAKLKIIIEDSQSDPKIGLNAFDKLINVERVPAVLTTLTNVAFSVRPLAEENHVIILAESSHPDLTKNFSYTFRNFYTTREANDLLINFIMQNNFSEIAILYINDDFGKSAVVDLETRSLMNNFKITSKESFERTETDFRTILLKIKDKDPKLIYVVGFGPSVAIIYNQAKELGIISNMIGFIICGQGNVFEAAKQSLEGTYSLEPYIDTNSKVYKQLLAIYTDRFPNRPLDQEVIVAFDAVNIVSDALNSGALTGEEIKDYLISKKRFEGASGYVQFDTDGDSKRPMKIVKIQNSECIDI